VCGDQGPLYNSTVRAADAAVDDDEGDEHGTHSSDTHERDRRCRALARGWRAHAATIDIVVSNGATREITGLYAAATVSSKWGPDQLNGVSLLQGDSVTLRVTCDQASIALVAEDAAGCFAYQTIGLWQRRHVDAHQCDRARLRPLSRDVEHDPLGEDRRGLGSDR
jgi:hypothetical protein